MKAWAFIDGKKYEGLDGRCAVCGQLVSPHQTDLHKHQGHPKSVYDADGRVRLLEECR